MFLVGFRVAKFLPPNDREGMFAMVSQGKQVPSHGRFYPS
jgi:hypothetical protein